jgi:hypothetical protein
MMQNDPGLNELVNGLFDAMANPQSASPGTHNKDLLGSPVSSEWELMRHTAFVDSQALHYGTRSTTILVAERSKKRLISHVFERTFSSTGAEPSLVRFMLKDWPPRYSIDPDSPTLLSPETGLQLLGSSTAQKTRVRTLLRPDIGLPKRLMQRRP